MTTLLDPLRLQADALGADRVEHQPDAIVMHFGAATITATIEHREVKRRSHTRIEHDLRLLLSFRGHRLTTDGLCGLSPLKLRVRQICENLIVSQISLEERQSFIAGLPRSWAEPLYHYLPPEMRP